MLDLATFKTISENVPLVMVDLCVMEKFCSVRERPLFESAVAHFWS